MDLLTPLANGIKVAQGPFRTRCSDITATGAVTLHYMMQGQGSRGFCRFECLFLLYGGSRCSRSSSTRRYSSSHSRGRHSARYSRYHPRGRGLTFPLSTYRTSGRLRGRCGALLRAPAVRICRGLQDSYFNELTNAKIAWCST